MVTLFIVLAALSFVLFFLQLGEAAWSKVDVAEVVRHEQENGQSASARIAKRILDQKPVGVNYFLLAIFLLMFFGPFELGQIMEREKQGCALWWAMRVYPFALFILGEMLPKMIGMKHALWWTLQTARPLFIIMRVCFPLTWLFARALKALGGYEDVVDEADVAAAARAAVDDEQLHPMEAHTIATFLRVNNLCVGEIMVPIAECVSVQMPAYLPTIAAAVRHLSHGIPIVALDKGGALMGYISAEGLLAALASSTDGKEAPLSSYIQGTVDVRHGTPVGEVLALLRGNRVLRVIGPKGRVQGMVTLDQVIRRVFQQQAD